MPTLIDRHGRVADRWIRADGAAPTLPTGASVLLALPSWRVEAPAWRARAARIGVLLAPPDDPREIAGDLDALALVAVEFPAFAVDRGHSIARLLRGRYRWRGELRAVGDLHGDQLLALSRCGFDSFALADGVDADAALAALRAFGDHHRTDANRGPLSERRSGRDRCTAAQAVREFPLASDPRVRPSFEENTT